MLKYWIACSAAALAASGVHAQAADNKAELFGQRASLQDVDISPDGQSIVYVAPGPGRQTVAYIAPLAGGTPQPILSSDANPPMLSWCSFVPNDRLICRIRALTAFAGTLDRKSTRLNSSH